MKKRTEFSKKCELLNNINSIIDDGIKKSLSTVVMALKIEDLIKAYFNDNLRVVCTPNKNDNRKVNVSIEYPLLK